MNKTPLHTSLLALLCASLLALPGCSLGKSPAQPKLSSPTARAKEPAISANTGSPKSGRYPGSAQQLKPSLGHAHAPGRPGDGNGGKGGQGGTGSDEGDFPGGEGGNLAKLYRLGPDSIPIPEESEGDRIESNEYFELKKDKVGELEIGVYVPTEKAAAVDFVTAEKRQIILDTYKTVLDAMKAGSLDASIYSFLYQTDDTVSLAVYYHLPDQQNPGDTVLMMTLKKDTGHTMYLGEVYDKLGYNYDSLLAQYLDSTRATLDSYIQYEGLQKIYADLEAQIDTKPVYLEPDQTNFVLHKDTIEIQMPGYFMTMDGGDIFKLLVSRTFSRNYFAGVIAQIPGLNSAVVFENPEPYWNEVKPQGEVASGREGEQEQKFLVVNTDIENHFRFYRGGFDPSIPAPPPEQLKNKELVKEFDLKRGQSVTVLCDPQSPEFNFALEVVYDQPELGGKPEYLMEFFKTRGYPLRVYALRCWDFENSAGGGGGNGPGSGGDAHGN